MFITDQGSQYTSEVHVNILNENNIKISMDGRARALDNIFVKRLCRSVNMKMYIRVAILKEWNCIKG